MNIILTGFMAAGKTEISKAIAAMSSYTLYDTDDMIEKKCGMSINEIFDTHGEKYFRQIEKEVVREASGFKNAVIATGGGVVLDKENIDVLRNTGII
ncbi:MAG: shikimate kinase, partial [Clostridia bacterium]|nr:shikimate kinase [Clostridia bacterium]